MHSDYSMPTKHYPSDVKDLFIYHPSTGTMIPLFDVVYLVEVDACSEAMLDEYSMGSNEANSHSKKYGYRLDNFNMTNLFFGDE